MEKTKTKSWSEMNKKEKIRTIFLGTIIGVFVGIILSSMFSDNTPSQNDNSISGLDPQTSYLALKEMGFSKNTNYGDEYGISWDCTKYDYGISYIVNIYAQDASNDAQSFRLNIMVEPGIEDISKGLWMMKELSGVKYDTSNPSVARDWVEANYNNDGATITIGDAVYTINAPSDYVRMMTISKKIVGEDETN